jgi:IS5 family transposase
MLRCIASLPPRPGRGRLREQSTLEATRASKGLMLKSGTLVDATGIAAPSAIKNSTGARGPARHQTKKGNPWHLGRKAYIGVGADSALVHTVPGTAANVNDVTPGQGLLNGEEQVVFAEAGYPGATQGPEATRVE